MTSLWGVFCLCLGFVHNFDQFISLRALLGLAEGGLFPGMVLYLSTIYTRSELALRIGVLYTSTSLSSGFGGLLARAMGAIGDRGGLTAWRWIFVIEGLFVSTLVTKPCRESPVMLTDTIRPSCARYSLI